MAIAAPGLKGDDTMTDATMSLAGKRVVVIGGTSGIGFAVALLARELVLCL
jgi:NADPH:quinone reductase-like Zn-dependent oxidoreductase